MARRDATAPLSGSVAVPLAFNDEASFRVGRRQWETLVKSDDRMTLGERLIVVHLASYAGADALAWPSAETLAADLRTSVPSVKRALRRGRERGWIISRGRRFFGGSVAYALGTDPTIATGVARYQEGQRIIRKIKRDHPDMKAPAPIRIANDTNGLSDHGRPFEGITGDTCEGSPAIHDPIQGTCPSILTLEASEEDVVLGSHNTESPKPRAAHTSARATGGPHSTTQDAVPLSEALTAALGRLGLLAKNEGAG